MSMERAAQRTAAPLPAPAAATDKADASAAAARGRAGEGLRTGEGLMEHLLGSGPAAPGADGLGDASVIAWAEDRGTLDGGRNARLGASCLLRPEAGDRVLTWRSGNECWILTVLERADSKAPAVLAAGVSSLAVKASTIALAGRAVHISSDEFLTSTRNRHAVENTRTETCKLRVSQVETDVRRAVTVNDEISGTLLQRAGTWLSSTLRDARFRARTFLFD